MLQPPPDRSELMSFIARIETSFALVPWSDSVFERSRSIPIVIVWPEEQSLKQVEGFVTMGNSQKPLPSELVVRGGLRDTSLQPRHLLLRLTGLLRWQARQFWHRVSVVIVVEFAIRSIEFRQ